MKRTIRGVVLVIAMVAMGCATQASPTPTPTTPPKVATPVAAQGEITLATTTSTADTGLLDYLMPIFKQQTGIEVKVVAVGSGQALALGRNGDADALLVHDPAGEEKLVADGFAIDRVAVMYNDFVIVGPLSDPAGIKGMKDATQAFAKIAAAKAPFISRGDKSGTDVKEKSIWAAAKITLDPNSGWYISSGQGMGSTLTMASEKVAYTLSDRGTYLAYKAKGNLQTLVEGDSILFNPYHVMAVNPAKYPSVKYDLAKRFIAFINSYDTQQKISTFGVDLYGQPLFFPDSAEWKAKKTS